ncbi:MAG: IS1/IS6 family transposase [Dehalococcoidia bacterium]|nr:MAG: IS1/IS6 family transposase [Dehalococcoidia bacterium]
MRRSILQRRNIITKIRYTTVKCKFCGDWESVVQYGKTVKGTQRYLCRKCKRTFLNNRAPERKQYPIEAIASVLNLFYESASLNKVQRQLKLTYGVSPDESTIYRWIVHYSRKAVKALGDVPIKAGSTWVADETVLKLKEKEDSKVWFWDIIDDKTRFLLASHLSESRGTKDAKILMERAARRAGRIPKTVITDKLAAYLDGVELAFGADTKHIPAKKLTSTNGTQIIERFHGTLKDRTKVLRSFMRKGTVRIFTDGWLVHYNFFRPHPAVGGKTPAEAAGADAPYKSWKDVVKSK